jgi:hypothetical protein
MPAVSMQEGEIMAKYFRWRKKEGAVPLKGPYVVIREMIEHMDWYKDTVLPFPERFRTYHIGLYLGERWHLKIYLQTIKRIYDDFE